VPRSVGINTRSGSAKVFRSSMSFVDDTNHELRFGSVDSTQADTQLPLEAIGTPRIARAEAWVCLRMWKVAAGEILALLAASVC
jgi:hypothetical protein